MEKMFLGIFGIVLILFLLSVFAPNNNTNPFWTFIRKIRTGMDRFSWWFLNGALVVCFGGSALYGLIKLYGAGTVIVSLVLIMLVIKAVYSLYSDHKAGIRCECTGDCAHCRIQCRSNPNYYGIR